MNWTEILVYAGVALAGYLLRHYGVVIPGLPGSKAPAPVPVAPTASPVLHALLQTILDAVRVRLAHPPAASADATQTPSVTEADLLALLRDLLQPPAPPAPPPAAK